MLGELLCADSRSDERFDAEGLLSRLREAMSAMALNQKHNCATHFHARIGMLSEPVKRDEPLHQRYT
jgi:hypothetical protein